MVREGKGSTEAELDVELSVWIFKITDTRKKNNKITD